MPLRRASGPQVRAKLSAWDHPSGGDAAALLSRRPLCSALELLVPVRCCGFAHACDAR